MRVGQQPAFILHRRAHGETSLLLEAFTVHHGRVGLLAKGARGTARAAAAVLKPFQPLLIGFSGRGELPVVTGAEADGAPFALNGVALYCGFYLNELLMRLLHRYDAHEAVFDAYRAALAALATEVAHEVALRLFEKRLLRELGYGLVLDHEVATHAPLEAQRWYLYVPERGPVGADGAARAPNGVQIRGASLLALAAERLDDAQALREIKTLMRAVLAHHLGGRPLHSRRLFQGPAAASRAEASAGGP